MDMSPPAFKPLVADPRRRFVVFCFLLTAMLISSLDNQIVSTALPTIVGEFDDLERFGWVGSAYLLTTSATMPIYGKLGDLFGRKYVMMGAIVMFLTGSLVCGLAWSMDSLIAARAFQGIGGGGIMVSIFSINADLFEPRQRAKYQSFSSLGILIAGSLGPTLGGTISELFGWRAIFLINLPVGILALCGIGFLLPYRRPDRKPKIDYLGAFLLASAVASMVICADSVSLFGSLLTWQASLVVLTGVLCATAWVFVEKRVPEPIVPLKLFKDSTFTLFLVVTFCSGSVAIGMMNYFALFMQTTTGLSPSVAGLFFISTTMGVMTGSLVTGRLISMTGRYKPFPITGLFLNVCALMAFSQLPAGAPYPLILSIMFVQGIAVGFGQQAPIIGVQNAVPRDDVGAATGAVTLMRMAGASIAISIYGAIISSGIKRAGAEVPEAGNISALTPALMSQLPETARLAVQAAYAQAFSPLFMTAAGLAFIGFVAACMLKPVRLPPMVHQKKKCDAPDD